MLEFQNNFIIVSGLAGPETGSTLDMSNLRHPAARSTITDIQLVTTRALYPLNLVL